MTTLIAALAFAAVYAVGAAVANRVSVYWLGFWNPKFQDQAGNVAVGDEVLPILVALMTVLFLAGVGVHRAAVGRTAPAQTAVAAAVCGALAAVLLLLEPGLRYVGVDHAAARTTGMVAFWTGPAALALGVIELLRRRRQSDEV